jgi:MoaA/NifB/PqqE/SkfB family radical SAM enzyme
MNAEDTPQAADPGSPASIAARLARWPRSGPQGPVTLELYPTLSCNLDCLFCDTTDRKRPPVGELSDQRLLHLIDEAAEIGVQRVFVLGGGEPLARRDLAPALLHAVKAHGMQGLLTTNGTLLGPALARQLVDDGWDEVHLSVDAADPETHDRLRGRPGAFRQTVRNGCRLGAWARAAGGRTKLALHCVITNQNLHSLRGLIDLAVALGAHRVDFDALIAYTDEQRALSLSPAQREALPALAAEALAYAEAAGVVTTLHHLCRPGAADRGQTAVPIPVGEGLAGAPCLKAWHHLVVQADGRLSPCCVLAGAGGSVADQPLWQAWTGDPFLEGARRAMLAQAPLPRCSECSWNILGHEAAIREALVTLGAPWA